jgi:hypothetical protein
MKSAQNSLLSYFCIIKGRFLPIMALSVESSILYQRKSAVYRHMMPSIGAIMPIKT